MKNYYLEITYRKGRPVAAYLYLPRGENDTSVRTVSVNDSIVIDLAANGRAIGIEILTPKAVDFAALDAALLRVGHPPIPREEFVPLSAA